MKSDTENKTGSNIRSHRIQQGLTLKELADKLGVKYQTIQAWERGDRLPKAENVIKIANALSTNPAELDDRFVIDLGSDYIHRSRDGSSITVSTGTLEAEALTLLNVMNTTGSKEWIKRGEEMAELDKYRKRKKS
ncbi:MAG: helix-turn-helix transcriptional regulator [Ruminococcaceae bacterium]|nr:helix-turn-helix transcriptional regulator [Oscillospiraceae bacterium]